MILGLALVLIFPYPALADDGAALGSSLGLSGECGTAQELIELLNNGTTEITLTDDIVFTQYVNANVGNVPATVYMGDFGITIESGARVQIYRQVRFEGNGVIKPLLTLESDSSFQMAGQSELEALGDGALAVRSNGGDLGVTPISIIADGLGATAFEGRGSGTVSFYQKHLYARGNGGTAVRVTGGGGIELRSSKAVANAISLDAAGDIKLDDSQIYGEIAISTAGSVQAIRTDIMGEITANGSVVAALCEIAGTISVGGEIILDTCYAEPLPEVATIITRQAAWFDDKRSYLIESYGFCITSEEEPNSPDTLTIGIWEVEQEKAYSYITVPVLSWRETDGETTGDITGWLETEVDLPRYLSGTENPHPGKIPIRLYDQKQPYLKHIGVNTKASSITIHAAQPFTGAEEVLLHVSVDDGGTWATYSSLDPFGKTYYTSGVFSFFIPVDETAHLFQYEVLGGNITGRSNILRAWYSKSGTQDPVTGDREGGGRGDGEEPGGTEPPGPGGGGGHGGTDETGTPPPSPPPTGGGEGGEDGDDNNDNSSNGGNGEEPPGGDSGGEGPAGNGSDGNTTGGGGGTGSGRQDGIAVGNTMADRQAPAGNEAPSASGQPTDTAQPVVSTTSVAITPVYPEGAAVYTAAELAALALANPERIAFLEGDLRAVLPTTVLLEAVDGGSLAILLEQSGGQGFHIRLYTEDGELEDLGGAVFQVSLPLPDGYEKPTCAGEDGAEVPVRMENGRIVCDLTRTGRYEVTGELTAAVTTAGDAPRPEPDSPPSALEPAGQDTPSGPQAAWRIALSCVAVCAAGVVFLRRRVRFG